MELSKKKIIANVSRCVVLLLMIAVVPVLGGCQKGTNGIESQGTQESGAVSETGDYTESGDSEELNGSTESTGSNDSEGLSESGNSTEESGVGGSADSSETSNAGNTTGSTGSNSTGGTTGSTGSNNTGGTTGSTGSTGSNTSSNLITDFGVANPSGSLMNLTSRVSVHDPSIEYDSSTNKWYIFGSHTAFARTSNLINWSYFEREGSSNAKYGEVFAKSSEWASKGSSSYNIEGNLWAPDVIYNKDLGKWCMYMSVNGDNFYSSIAMATADSITGPYTYQGTVVFSGFMNASDVALTDYQKATGTTDISRYTSGGWGYYGTNAIDPCVLYDKDGELWMTYGSWFGGIFMLKLDNETGLRDYSYTYTLDTNASDNTAADPYLGIRISGGYGGTGEGPYIVWDEEAGYYYLYVSYCGLNATDTFSGYQMRLFRSKEITGPYVDAAGNCAIRKNSNDDQSVKGIKIMGNYNFSSLSTASANTGSQNGYRSPGHNSAIVDNEGNHYLIYHTRFNGGSEWHQVRVHQQFLNEDGWLVTAPYEYLGSKISESGYSESEIVGSYELINHGNEVTFNVVAPMLSTYVVNLNANHTITGDFEGTWSQKSGSYYATIKIDGVTYKGVFFKQYDESSSHKETMTFSVIGSNNIALWGSRVGAVVAAETGNQVAAYTFDNTGALGKDTIGTVGSATIYGCTTYTDSERGKVLAFDGVDDYVQLNAKATEYDSYTIMMWFKSTSDATWQRLIDLGDSSSSSMFVTTHAWEAGLRFAQQINGDGEKQINTSSTTLNQWTHVAITVSGSSKNATMYVNGVRVGGVTLSAVPSDYAGTANYLGKSQYDDPYFQGYMDDVMIFDYALSTDEIKKAAGL